MTNLGGEQREESKMFVPSFGDGTAGGVRFGGCEDAGRVGANRRFAGSGVSRFMLGGFACENFGVANGL